MRKVIFLVLLALPYVLTTDCTSQADCAKAPEGSACVAGTCKCITNQDCATPYVYGNLCFNTLADAICGCLETSHCGDSSYGPQCNKETMKCYCDSDADCDYRTYGGKCDSTTRTCKCSTDADCTANSWGALCDTTNSRCKCASDSDCGSKYSFGNSCNLADNVCSCNSDADCDDHTLGGSKCDTSKGKCFCSEDADCEESAAGPKCKSWGSCGCTAHSQCKKDFMLGTTCVEQDLCEKSASILKLGYIVFLISSLFLLLVV